MSLPIGISDFKEMIQNNYTLVDKTLFIKDIISDGSKAILITRPRRFGKTTNMSMLFSYLTNSTEEQNLKLFDNLLISHELDIKEKHYHQYPVIFITFKDIKANSYEETIGMVKYMLSELYEHFELPELLDTLSTAELEYFGRIVDNKVSDIIEIKTALAQLIKFLERLYNKKVIVLIDEYDTPLHVAFDKKYYDKVIEFFRGFLGLALKDNSSLQKAVITGITRVAQASIFSELNHIEVYSVLREDYGQYFGFTHNEVVGLLEKYDIDIAIDDIKSWYNGYEIGKYTIYNPWSILNCCKRKGALSSYWLHTSDNILVKNLITKSKPAVKDALSRMMRGEKIEQLIQENLVFQYIDNNEESIWALLLYSGYLTLSDQRPQGSRVLANLYIPNKEVKAIYDEIIESWFVIGTLGVAEYNRFIRGLVNGDIETFEKILGEYILTSGSVFDFNKNTKEDVFQAFILGLISGLDKEYLIDSNKESGYGRSDITIIPYDTKKKGIIIELKVTTNESELDKKAQDAIKQIIDKQYSTTLKSHKIQKALLIGIAFCGKRLKLIHKEIDIY